MTQANKGAKWLRWLIIILFIFGFLRWWPYLLAPFFWRGRVHQALGQVAAQQLEKWFDVEIHQISDVKGYWFATGFPADPAYYFRFHIESAAVGSFVKRRALRIEDVAQASKNLTPLKSLPMWWNPVFKGDLEYFVGKQGSNYFHLLYNRASNIAYLYVQNS